MAVDSKITLPNALGINWIGVTGNTLNDALYRSGHDLSI